jgi:hypothetical protein|eukprot:scaffold1022_cov196-Alexandrium_tamarense.AAC.24
MMKRLPIRTIPIPIEPRPHILPILDIKVLTQPINNPFKRGRSVWLLANQMCSLMPTDPLGTLDVFLLNGSHLFY